jgi:hypothetical protein
MRDTNHKRILNKNIGTFATLLTGALGTTTPATWAAITNGSFRLTIDGTARNIDAINFTGDATMEDVAATIQAAIRAITSGSEVVSFDSATNKITITSGISGTSSQVSVLSTSTGTVGTDISGASYLNGATGVGVATAGIGGYSEVFPCKDYEDIVIAFSSTGTGSSKARVLGAIVKDIDDVNFQAAKSDSNVWNYVHLTPIDTQAGVVGSTGLANTNSDVKIAELDMNGLSFVCVEIYELTGGVETSIDITGFSRSTK